MKINPKYIAYFAGTAIVTAVGLNYIVGNPLSAGKGKNAPTHYLEMDIDGVGSDNDFALGNAKTQEVDLYVNDNGKYHKISALRDLRLENALGTKEKAFKSARKLHDDKINQIRKNHQTIKNKLRRAHSKK